MKSSRLLFFSGITALVIAAFLIHHRVQNQWDAKNTLQTGRVVFENVDFFALDQILYQRDSQRITLFRQNDRWFLSERDSYPVNANTLSALILALKRMRVSEQIETPFNDQTFGTLTLRAKNAPLAPPLLLGDIRASSDFSRGRYYAFLSGERAPSTTFLSLETLSALEQDVTAFLDPAFQRPESIQSFRVSTPEKTYAFARRIAAEPFSPTVKAPAMPDSAMADTLAYCLTALDFTDVVPEKDAPDFSHATRISAETFDHERFIFEYIAHGADYLLRITPSPQKDFLYVIPARFLNKF